MHNFFITGLPRTRTSWFAALLTNGNSFCFHEPTKTCKNSFEIHDLLSNRPEQYKGVSDCLVPFYYEPLADTLRNHRLVFIERDFDEVVLSLLKWIRSDINEDDLLRQLKSLQSKIEYIKGRYEHRSFSFNDLDKPSVVEEIWYYCIPGMSFDRQRYDMLNQLKIEPHAEKYDLKQYTKNVNSIMGVS